MLLYRTQLSEGSQSQHERQLPLIISITVNLNLHGMPQWISSAEQLTANAIQKWQSGRVCETQFSVIFIVRCFLPEHLLNRAVFWEMLNNSVSSLSMLIGWKCRWVYWSWSKGLFSSSLKIHCKFHLSHVKGFQLKQCISFKLQSISDNFGINWPACKGFRKKKKLLISHISAFAPKSIHDKCGAVFTKPDIYLFFLSEILFFFLAAIKFYMSVIKFHSGVKTFRRACFALCE